LGLNANVLGASIPRVFSNAESVALHSPGSRSAPWVRVSQTKRIRTLKGFYKAPREFVVKPFQGFSISAAFVTQGALRDPGL
jgi:hypothetical protein